MLGFVRRVLNISRLYDFHLFLFSLVVAYLYKKYADMNASVILTS